MAGAAVIAVLLLHRRAVAFDAATRTPSHSMPSAVQCTSVARHAPSSVGSGAFSDGKSPAQREACRYRVRPPGLPRPPTSPCSSVGRPLRPVGGEVWLLAMMKDPRQASSSRPIMGALLPLTGIPPWLCMPEMRCFSDTDQRAARPSREGQGSS